MKTGILIVACWTALALSCGAARAQDTNRVPDINQGVNAVDASVHAGVGDGTLQEPQPSQDPVKLPTTYSRWAFSPSGHPPSTQYWPAHAKIPPSAAAHGDGESPSTHSTPSFQAVARPLASIVWSARFSNPTVNLVNDSNSGKLERQPRLFHSLDIGRTEDGSTGPQLFKTKVPTLSPQPQADGFSTPFREGQFGLTSDSSSLPPVYPKSTFSSQRDRVTASRRKSHTKKSPDSNHTGAVAGFHSNQERASRTRLTTKAE